MESRARQPYPTDVSDDEWAFVAPYLTPMAADAPPRRHDLREVFNAPRRIVRTGAQWPMLPTNLRCRPAGRDGGGRGHWGGPASVRGPRAAGTRDNRAAMPRPRTPVRGWARCVRSTGWEVSPGRRRLWWRPQPPAARPDGGHRARWP